MKPFITAVIILILISLTSSYELPSDSNTIALWHFNENKGDTLHDASGHGNHGIIHGGTWGNGPWGPYLRFNGVGSYVFVPQRSSLEPSTAITIECVAYAETQINTANCIRLVRKAGGLQSGYILSWQQTGTERVELRIDNFPGSPLVTGDPTNSVLRKNEWLYIAGTFMEGDSSRLFINQKLVNAVPSGDCQLIHTDHLYIAGNPAYENELFTGRIDEIRISKVARAPHEIQNNYQNLFDFGPRLVHIADPTLTRRPFFRWHAAANTSSYLLQIDTTPDFNKSMIQISISDTVFQPLSDLPFGMIYWRVKSDYLEAFPLPVGVFYIQSPSIPALSRFNGARVAGDTIRFKWQKVPNASIYKIFIDTTPSFISPYLQSVNLADTTFTPLVALTPNKYYWKVCCNLDYSQFGPADSVIVISKLDASAPDIRKNPESLEIFPNPFFLRPTLVFHDFRSSADVSIYSIEGKLIYQVLNNRLPSLTLKNCNFSPGIYFVNVKTKSAVFRNKILSIK